MKLIGYNSFYSKKNDTNYYQLQLTYPFREGEGHGQAVYQQFVDKTVYDMVDNNMLNHEIKFDRVDEGRFQRIVGVHVEVNEKGK